MAERNLLATGQTRVAEDVQLDRVKGLYRSVKHNNTIPREDLSTPHTTGYPLSCKRVLRAVLQTQTHVGYQIQFAMKMRSIARRHRRCFSNYGVANTSAARWSVAAFLAFRLQARLERSAQACAHPCAGKR